MRNFLPISHVVCRELFKMLWVGGTFDREEKKRKTRSWVRKKPSGFFIFVVGQGWQVCGRGKSRRSQRVFSARAIFSGNLETRLIDGSVICGRRVHFKVFTLEPKTPRHPRDHKHVKRFGWGLSLAADNAFGSRSAGETKDSSRHDRVREASNP